MEATTALSKYPSAPWLAHLYVLCKGGDGDVGGRVETPARATSSLSRPRVAVRWGRWPRLASVRWTLTWVVSLRRRPQRPSTPHRG
jgi:hypothetical protein